MWAGWRDVEGRPWRGGTPRSQGRRDRGESTSGCGGHPGMSRAGLLARPPPCSCFTNQYVIPAGWVQPDLCGAEATRRRWPGDCRSALTLRRTTRPRMASREGVDTVLSIRFEPRRRRPRSWSGTRVCTSMPAGETVRRRGTHRQVRRVERDVAGRTAVGDREGSGPDVAPRQGMGSRTGAHGMLCRSMTATKFDGVQAERARFI